MGLKTVLVVENEAVAAKYHQFRLVLLETDGKVWQWCPSDRAPVRTVFIGPQKFVFPVQIFCAASRLNVVGPDGELFTGNYERRAAKHGI